MSRMGVSQAILDELALTRAEYDLIVKTLGREPNELELGMYGALWSEHCGYKHTAKLIKTIPSKSKRALTDAGAENAGVLDIGDGLAVAFKIESHNHPSAVEPVQGAATGVGGIVRDILAMGARPIALLNSLRFGPPRDRRQKFLFNGVVEGISNYGNCIGVPNVGGEIVFDDSYAGNPLVNAMCVGVIEDGKIMRASAKEPGDLLVLVGSDTGRDGIHGASGLASRSFEGEREAKSAVQVGNPFFEKVLIESCLRAKDLEAVRGMQDCGAAGLTSAAIEMALRSNLGLVVDVAQVPCRSAGMTAYEIMLSESQERMLLAVARDGFESVRRLFAEWDLNARVFGEFVSGADATVKDGDSVLCVTPIAGLTSPPQYDLIATSAAPKRSAAPYEPRVSDLPPREMLLKLLGSPNIASRAYVYRQYDHQVQNNTVIPPGGDAAVIRIQNTTKALAVATDGNGRFCELDPRVGAQIAVAEACRNVAMTGARPLALTDGLNFGDPANARVKRQLVSAAQGIADAARALDVPVISGNASLYNEHQGRAIHPTPIIGAVGLLEDVAAAVSIAFKDDGDLIAVVGAATPWDAPSGLAGSEYSHILGDELAGAIKIDLDLEARLQRAVCALAEARLIKSAHDCSLGGVAVALARCALAGALGATIETPLPAEPDAHAALFGEAQSRAVVSLAPSRRAAVEQTLRHYELPYQIIGAVGGAELNFGGRVGIGLKECAAVWENGLEKAIAH